MFLKECKKIGRSFVFWIFAAAILFTFVTQFAPELRAKLQKPVKGNDSYGSVITKDPEVIMPAAVKNLVEEYVRGYYVAYPMMFYKKVFLKEEDSVKIAAILEELTGLTKEELDSFTDYEPEGTYYMEAEGGGQIPEHREAVLPEYTLQAVSYERFLALMEQADDLIGGGSGYGKKRLILDFSAIPMDYEAALEEYEDIMEDGVGKAYIRLYCDYMSIFLGILPVFAAAAFWDMDRRSRAEAVIYSRKVSSLRIVGTRYGALVLGMAFPLLLTLVYTVTGLNGLYPETDTGWTGGLMLAVIWLLPELMTVIALGMVVTELISPLPAVLIQGLWWYLSLGRNELTGTVTKWSLILRHNSLTGLDVFREEYPTFLWNRSFYLVLALALVAAEVFIYRGKRRGRMKCVFDWKS